MFELRQVQLYPPRELVFSIGDAAVVRRSVTRARGRVDPLVGVTYLQTCAYLSGSAEAAPFDQPALIRFKKRFANRVAVDGELEANKRLGDADISAKAMIEQGKEINQPGDEAQRENERLIQGGDP